MSKVLDHRKRYVVQECNPEYPRSWWEVRNYNSLARAKRVARRKNSGISGWYFRYRVVDTWEDEE